MVVKKGDYLKAHKKKVLQVFRLTGLCGERGSRTYAFKKYHKIANH